MYMLVSTFFLFYLINLSCTQLECQKANNSASDIFKLLTDESHYKKWMIPSEFLDRQPLIVKVKLHIFHLEMKETSKLDIKMQVMLELNWEDPRLIYKDISRSITSITGGNSHLDSMWLPRVIFTNERDSQKMGTNRKDDFITILPDGSILLTTRLLTSMVCLLHLGKFPFDQQICHLYLDSLTYNASRLQLEWDEGTSLQIQNVAESLVEFDVLEIKQKTAKEVNFDDENVEQFSSLVIEMKLERHYGYYLLNYYLPSELLVIISWFSFWIHPSSVPARVTLGVSTMLTFILLDMTGGTIPRTSQFMANDIWAVTCTAFIFLSLTEFAFVNSIERKQGVEKVHLKKLSSKHILRGGVDTAAGRAKIRRSSSCPSSPEIRRHFARNPNSIKTFKDLKEVSISLGNLIEGGNKSEPSNKNAGNSLFTMTPQEIAMWIDTKSRIFFPVAFLIFNFFYWVPLKLF